MLNMADFSPFPMISTNGCGEVLTERWGACRIISRGKVYQGETLPGFVAISEEGQLIGLITYHIGKRECEVISLDSFQEGMGIGTNCSS